MPTCRLNGFEDSNQSKWRFQQVKHKQNTDHKKISVSDLISDDNTNDFSLQKYFISFCKIKYNEYYGSDAIFEDFTILTNTDFDFIGYKKNINRNNHRNEVKKWEKYFAEESDLKDDPILQVKKYQPKKYKFTESAKQDLYDLFNSSLLENILKIKEINNWAVIKKKFELDMIAKVKHLLNIIRSECKTKKRKSLVTRWANKTVTLIENFVHKNECQKRMNTNVCKCVMCNLKESIDVLKKPCKKPCQEKEVINNRMQDVRSKVEAALNRVEQNINDLVGDALKAEKNKLLEDERELKEMRENIWNSNDLEWIKQEITKDVFNQEHRISKKDIKSIQKEERIEDVQNILEKKFQSIFLDISMIKIGLNDKTFNECLNEFLAKFRIIINYPNELELSNILREEIGEKFSLLNADLLRDSFEREMINFLKEKSGRIYNHTEGEEFFTKLEQQIHIFMSIGLCLAYTDKLDAYGIYFDEQFKEIKKLTDFLSTKNKKILHISCEFTRLNAIKVFRNLKDSGKFVSHDSYIFFRLSTILDRKTSREFILNAFKSGMKLDDDPESMQKRESVDLCVIECRGENLKNIETDMENLDTLFSELKKILSDNPQKQILIIAPEHDKLSERFRIHYDDIINNPNLSVDSGVNLNEHEPSFEKIEDEIEFKHLSYASQDKVLAKEIKFQEKDRISFDQLIDKNLACKIIDSENLLRLIENELIHIGDEKAFHSIGYVEEYYVTRQLNIEPNPVDETNNMDEIDLVQKRLKLILLSNDAGMGKSTALTSLAKEIRKINKNAWIARIDLNDHAGNAQHSLNRIKFKEFEINKANNFVAKMVIRGKENANIRLQRALFEASLEKTEQYFKKPPIVILFDGFDEISNIENKNNENKYNKQTTTLISALNASDVKQIWVTTRPVEEDHLQNKFGSDIYYLRPLTADDQIKFLDSFLKWNIICGKHSIVAKSAPDRTFPQMYKHLKIISELKVMDISDILNKYRKVKGDIDDIENLKKDIKSLSFDEYVKKNLLSIWSKSAFAKDNNFHSTPLNLKMLIVVFSAEKQLPSNLKLYNLYDKFVNIQFEIYHKDKSKSKLSNKYARNISEDHKQYLNKVHYSLAVKVLFPKDYNKKGLPDLLKLDELNEIQQEEKTKDKIISYGLLTLRSDEFQFIHPSYSEFFFSKYLINQLTDKRVQKILIEKILVESAYGFTRQFFNDRLQEPDDQLQEIIEQDTWPTSASKQFIVKNLQKNSKNKNNMLTLLTNENHLDIIDVLKLNEIMKMHKIVIN